MNNLHIKGLKEPPCFPYTSQSLDEVIHGMWSILQSYILFYVCFTKVSTHLLDNPPLGSNCPIIVEFPKHGYQAMLKYCIFKSYFINCPQKDYCIHSGMDIHHTALLNVPFYIIMYSPFFFTFSTWDPVVDRNTPTCKSISFQSSPNIQVMSCSVTKQLLQYTQHC